MKLFFKILLFSLFFTLIGCATALKGESFKNADTIPNGKAIVYFYWTDFPDTKTRIDYSLFANGHKITDMKHGGVFEYIAPEGTLEFTTNVNPTFMAVGILDAMMAPKGKLSLKVEPGHAYYVRCVSNGLSASNYNLVMMQVDEKRGLYELRGSKLLPPAKDVKTVSGKIHSR